jgi:hypothetical protein
MTRRRRNPDTICRALILALVLLGCSTRAQNVILHLRNGDRLAGAIISESTNEVRLSTIWSKELVVPVSQIERREILPAEVTAAPTTNGVVPAKPVVVSKTTNAPPAVPWYKHWKGDASIGTDLERGGTTDRALYYGKLNLTYSHPYARDPKQFFRNIFTYSAEYGKTDGTVSANDMGGSSKTDFDFSRKIYAYNLGAASYDVIRKIDLHYEDGPGAGYHLFTGTNFIVNTELGANYQVEYRSDDTSTHSVYYRLAEDVTWKINHQMNLTEKYEFFPRVDNLGQYRSRFESTLSYALMLNFSLNVSVIDLYDTQPATGVPANDFQLRTSLGVKF